jgi:serine/threonine protein kinase
MLYEMLMGKTPFHAYEMKDLLSKINDGKYEMELEEPISAECALFLAETLQFEEKERLADDKICHHPFVCFEQGAKLLTLSNQECKDFNVSQFEKFNPYESSDTDMTSKITHLTLSIKDKTMHVGLRSALAARAS